MRHVKLNDLVDIYSPNAVLEEVEIILTLISPDFNLLPVRSAFNMIVSVFEGRHAAYRACNTYYHDLRHTTDAFLAMARLIHGALLENEPFKEDQIITALIAALFHDAGYIQEKTDTEGTGAKYSLYHVERSADFLRRHGFEHGLSRQQVAEGCSMIKSTDLAVPISSIQFPSPTVELLGRMLNAADLLGQMSDRTYLEKLLFLYHEYKEGNVGNYGSEVDLLRKTLEFYEFINKRLQPVAARIDRYMISHLNSRWNINKNLYTEAIEGQKRHLKKILAIPNADPRDHLSRYDVIERVRSIYGID
ncbi:MAG: hypothetical protein JRI79_02670 [Deltaproteobacteria bacterium]|nr:hypothetical protein [Deltaproteobacteria bacterium]MBW2043891.1 hypothetical protein [Deltaproteobacteria bacterium]MBW2300064.1 hypothetical protein [Deltaproteobacteria bacterium]